MIPLAIGQRAGEPIRLLAIGAHPDDIEIGAGGTLLRLLAERSDLTIDLAVLSGDETRAAEARDSAAGLLGDRGGIDVASFRDGFFPAQFAELKEHFIALRERFIPDVVLVSRRDDLHQDHRLAGELAWQTFRDRLILEYEVPKWDADLGTVNLYVDLERSTCERKIDLLLERFGSQRAKRWFSADTFWAMLRLRGIESGGETGFAEGFIVRKARLRA
jgi:LmbE family N-acetylglucosaminyl deacetylase